jgi:carboxymethylenebutenolidase
MSESQPSAEKNPNTSTISGSLTDQWDLHLRSEFAAKSTEEAMATMTDTPRVNIVPTMLGALNAEDLKVFYSQHFLNQIPPDMEMTPVSRTVGEERVVDELVLRFTHSIVMDWMLPGVPPTNKRIEMPMVVIVQFDPATRKIAHEHIYWDMGTVMLQAGLIDASLPVRGAECARQALDPVLPMNELIKRR